MTNPLLNFSDLPLFDRILPAHVGPAMDDLLAKAEIALAQVTVADFPPTWTGIARVLDVATENLGRAWGAVSHLNSVADTPELRAAYNAALPRVTEFWTRLGADERLYAKYKAIDVASLNDEQRQAHKNAIRNFALSGAELAGSAKERFAQIQERQAELSQKFSENTLDATDAFAYYATDDEVAGIPEDVLQSAKAQAEAEGKAGYRLSLKMPSYLPVMQFAQSSALRETLYKAYTTRASDQAPAEFSRFDNSAFMREILALRQEESRLLGFANFGEVSVVAKMAKSPEEVVTFLRDLARRARPYAEKDIADLRAFAAEKLKQTDPQPWDHAYIGEKLKEARYAFSEQEVKQYFTAPKVLAGLFRIVETLFEVAIREDSAPVWKPGVAFYRIERDGQLLGQFYLDQPARTGKRG
ncbi:MAG: M3 family metallopeptidase, partial [Polaromonas sp.]